MKAIVLGATGSVGKDLTELLLNDDSFDSVEIFVRRDPDFSNPKLITHVVDFDNIYDWKNLIKGDVAFSCLGTTLKAAGSKEAQYKVDYTYQYEFAKAASDNGVSDYILVSSAMADSKSSIFYTRMKGELEDAVKKLPFKKICIVRPPSLIRKNTDRMSEKITLPVIRFFNKLGLLKSQTPMDTCIVAKTMINVAKGIEAPQIIDGQEINKFAI